MLSEQQQQAPCLLLKRPPRTDLCFPFLHAVAAHVPLFLYPFLNTVSRTRPFEYLRLTSLGVIGALVKVDDTDVINFLLSTEIIPLCLRTMEMGSELSKTVATFIVQKILLDDVSAVWGPAGWWWRLGCAFPLGARAAACMGWRVPDGRSARPTVYAYASSLTQLVWASGRGQRGRLLLQAGTAVAVQHL